jgi:hypothetical protein
MRPLYDARISDLGPGDLVAVECACGHTETLTAAMLATAGVRPGAKDTVSLGNQIVTELRREAKH